MVKLQTSVFNILQNIHIIHTIAPIESKIGVTSFSSKSYLHFPYVTAVLSCYMHHPNKILPCCKYISLYSVIQPIHPRSYAYRPCFIVFCCGQVLADLTCGFITTTKQSTAKLQTYLMRSIVVILLFCINIHCPQIYITITKQSTRKHMCTSYGNIV